ncbi:MAG: threonine/serine exporter family protein [Phycisphaerales bacterium]
MKAESSTAETDTLLEFMYRLGQGYLACGEQTALVELFLRRIATARGMRRSRVVAFPTAIFIAMHDGVKEHVTIAEGPLQTLRLDQVAEVYTLGEAAQRGEVTPQDGLKRLNETLRKPTRFGIVGALAGHVILTLGLALVLAPALANLVAAAVLGTVVGAVKALNRNRPILSAPLSVVAATLVSALVFLAVKKGLYLHPLDVLVPPLVTFLPGAMLTFGMVELAYGDMVSGSSRLITGFVQLVLLAFGLAAGAVIVGYTPDNLVDSGGALAAAPWGPLTPWIGVLVFGLGVSLHFSAPRNSLPWMLLVMLVAFAAQRLATRLFGQEISGFFGMLVATPLGYLIQQRFPSGPPSMVTFLPSFWLLVPGSLGLLSVTRMLSDRAAGLDGLIAAVFAIASIALGTLVGASLYQWATEKFGLWRLQIGRVGSYLRQRSGR